MHLVVNASELGRNRGGNESYIAGLLEGLSAVQSRVQVTAITCEWEPLPALPEGLTGVSLGLYRPLSFWTWQQSQLLRELKPDWYLSNFFLPLLPCAGAVVVHDVSFRAHPEYFPRFTAWYMHALTWLSMQRATRIITGSEFSRSELQRFYPATSHKIAVVPDATSSYFRPAESEEAAQRDAATLARFGVAEPYILALGNIHPRKNLARLLEAYIQARAQDKRVPSMVWVGQQRWGADDLLTRAKEHGVIMTGFVPQAELRACLRNADMLIYPSLYEGFGLPPLEAMASGTPVITSSTTSLPEVVGDAAVLVDPTSVDAISEAILRLSRDKALCRDLRERGLARAGHFSWQHTAEGLIAALS